jgi:putative tricarboxylic transport membrane protein
MHARIDLRFWLGLGLLALAGLAAYGAASIPASVTYARVGPAIGPWFVAAFLALLGAATVVQAMIGHHDVIPDSDAEPDPRGLRFVLAGLCANIVLIEPDVLWQVPLGAFRLLMGDPGSGIPETVIPAPGFIIASSVMFVLVARGFGSLNWARDLGIGLALAFVSYLGFDKGLGYRIGTGFIETQLIDKLF